jgi:hypothetical protein
MSRHHKKGRTSPFRKTEHIALLGDSILDNKAYVSESYSKISGQEPGPAVTEHLQSLYGRRAKVTLLAVDGSVTDTLHWQLRDVTEDMTRLVVSIGGNDALRYVSMLSDPVDTVGEALDILSDMVYEFEMDYADALDGVLAMGIPVTVCTIYNPNFDDFTLYWQASTALALLNDAIIRYASQHGLPVTELRHICTEEAHYANSIEPSAEGGALIAAAIKAAA